MAQTTQKTAISAKRKVALDKIQGCAWWIFCKAARYNRIRKEDKMKLYDKIRIIRKARGFSQEGLGDSLSRVSKDGISRQSISDWENGKSEPKLDNIRDLASVLNVSFDALLDESIDLNDSKVLARVLHNAPPQAVETVNSEFSYSLYVSTVSVKSYKNVIVAACALVLTVLLIVVCLLLRLGLAWIYVVAIGGGLFLSFLIIAIFDLKRIIRGRERARVGSLNNTHLIIYQFKNAYNTLYVPIKQITKIELGANQKKNSGDALVWIVGRSRAITLPNLQNPQKLIDVFQELTQDHGSESVYVV